MTKKWTVNDVLEAFEKAMSGQGQVKTNSVSDKIKNLRETASQISRR